MVLASGASDGYVETQTRLRQGDGELVSVHGLRFTLLAKGDAIRYEAGLAMNSDRYLKTDALNQAISP